MFFETKRGVFFLVIQNKQTGPFTQGTCALSLCVLFALGRRFKGKKCNDVICYPETLLQVQSGDNNKLGKYTRIPEQNTNSNGIRPPCQILVENILLSVFVFLSHSQKHTHTVCTVSSFIFPFSGHWPAFRSSLDGSQGSSGFITHQQHEQMQLWN